MYCLKDSRRRVNPRMLHIRYAVKLQHNGLPVFGFRDDLKEMLESPLWIRVASRGNQQRIMAARIESRADLQGPVFDLRRSSPARQAVTALDQSREAFRPKKVSAVRETNRLRHIYFLQLVFDQREFARQSRRIAGNGEVGVGPRVIADLESHRMDLSHVPPGHEVFRVFHPVMRDKESSSESQFLQKRRNEAAMRFDSIVKCEHYQLLWYPRDPRTRSGAGLKKGSTCHVHVRTSASVYLCRTDYAESMLVIHVHVHVKPEFVEAFRQATIANARASLSEPGVARFDVLEQTDDASRFVLAEAYRSPEAAAQHKETGSLPAMAGYGCRHDGRSAQQRQICEYLSGR